MRATNLKLGVVGVVAASLLAVSGCVARSELDAKVAELKKETDKLSQADQNATQLTKDLDAAKAARQADAEKLSKAEEAVAKLQKDFDAAKVAADKAKSDLEAQVKKLQQENADLKTQSEQASQVATLLRKTHDAEKVAADKVKTDLEAKIKTLEQENAELKKAAPKPVAPPK